MRRWSAACLWLCVISCSQLATPLQRSLDLATGNNIWATIRSRGEKEHGFLSLKCSSNAVFSCGGNGGAREVHSKQTQQHLPGGMSLRLRGGGYYVTKADFIKAGTEYDEYNMLQDWGMVSERGKSDRADQREGGTDRQSHPLPPHPFFFAPPVPDTAVTDLAKQEVVPSCWPRSDFLPLPASSSPLPSSHVRTPDAVFPLLLPPPPSSSLLGIRLLFLLLVPAQRWGTGSWYQVPRRTSLCAQYSTDSTIPYFVPCGGTDAAYDATMCLLCMTLPELCMTLPVDATSARTDAVYDSQMCLVLNLCTTLLTVYDATSSGTKAAYDPTSCWY
eukprot:1107382-Rhodomonas_salina.2